MINKENKYIINNKIKENIETIFNKILELKEIGKMYRDKAREDPAIWRDYRDALTDIVYNLLRGKEVALDKNLDKLYALMDGIFNIMEYIMYALYRVGTYHGCGEIEEWRQDFDAISVRDSAFAYLVGSLQNSSSLRVVCGSAYMTGEQRGVSVVNLNTEDKLTIVNGSLLTWAALADKIKVMEVNGSLTSFIENVKTWLAFVESKLAKINVTHSIAVYNVSLLHGATIKVKPIEIDFIDVRKTAALVESLMRPLPLVGYARGRFFDFFEKVRRLYDEGWDRTKRGLRAIYEKAGSAVGKYVNRYLGPDARISMLGFQIDVLVGDMEIAIPRESMSLLSIHCPANVVLDIDGDKTICDEKSYIVGKPPRPWSKESNISTFVKLYIDAAVGKRFVKILFE